MVALWVLVHVEILKGVECKILHKLNRKCIKFNGGEFSENTVLH